jgi:hypothetical protein
MPILVTNRGLRQGFVPSLRKSAKVSPVHRSSPALKASTQTFVPSPSQPLLAKFWSRFLTAGFSNQLIAGKIDPLQFGALRDWSASMARFKRKHKSYEACDDLGSSLRIYLLDFSKVFDQFDHNVLLRKLQQMVVHPILINWIPDFVSNKLQRTKIGQE